MQSTLMFAAAELGTNNCIWVEDPDTDTIHAARVIDIEWVDGLVMLHLDFGALDTEVTGIVVPPDKRFMLAHPRQLAGIDNTTSTTTFTIRAV